MYELPPLPSEVRQEKSAPVGPQIGLEAELRKRIDVLEEHVRDLNNVLNHVMRHCGLAPGGGRKIRVGSTASSYGADLGSSVGTL